MILSFDKKLFWKMRDTHAKCSKCLSSNIGHSCTPFNTVQNNLIFYEKEHIAEVVATFLRKRTIQQRSQLKLSVLNY